jgi:hypothetical protein
MRNCAFFCTTATYELRVSRQSHLRDHHTQRPSFPRASSADTHTAEPYTDNLVYIARGGGGILVTYMYVFSILVYCYDYL